MGEFERLSIDEVSQRKGHQDIVTVMSDIDQGQLVEVIDIHRQEDIIINTGAVTFRGAYAGRLFSL